jgi:hypothetical protein
VVPAAFQKMSKPDAQLRTRAFREQARSYRFGGLREIFGVLKIVSATRLTSGY